MQTARKLEPTQKPQTQKFSLRTPYMKQGRITQLVAETENMWIHTKINYEGGESEIHCHLDEDHSFIVLEGQMSVFDENGGGVKGGKHQGVMFPKGADQRIPNIGQGDLGVVRGRGGAPGPEEGGRGVQG